MTGRVPSSSSWNASTRRCNVRLDPVLILGQSVGFISYSRNIMLSLHGRKA